MAERTKFDLTLVFSTGIASMKIGSQTYTSNTTITFDKDTNVTVTVTASSGYRVGNSTYSYVMNTDHTCQPTPIKTYTLTITKNTGIASISVKIDSGTATSYTSSTTITIDSGSKVVCSATAASDYTLDDGSSKTWDSVSSNITFAPTASANQAPVSYPKVNISFEINKTVLGLSCTIPNSINLVILPQSTTVNPSNVSTSHNNASEVVVYYNTMEPGHSAHSLTVGITLQGSGSAGNFTGLTFKVDANIVESPTSGWSGTVAGHSFGGSNSQSGTFDVTGLSGGYSFEMTISW